ncbi:hypothetical protein F2P81_013448 [Scophthalmus maximus]|uniref:Uncharacterized protein n=1 Tax=Scophthalmus maximus TaxID=52904 RepID=A0A6A4STF0_SCOMX|nr:hypothetical protein F2P81_013448 [Scophthalmus maximus]
MLQTGNRQQTDVNMVSLFRLAAGLSAVDGNSGVSQCWLETSLYHPSPTGSHCRFSDAFRIEPFDSVLMMLVWADRQRETKVGDSERKKTGK